MTATEHITVPEFLGAGDYVLRYRGTAMAPDFQEGDYLIVREQSTAAVGQLVIADADGGTVTLCRCTPAVKVRGLVTGMMRRLDESAGAR